MKPERLEVEPPGRIRPACLDTEAACAYLGNISRDKLRDLYQHHQLPVLRLDARVVFPVDALDRWVRERTTSGNASDRALAEVFGAKRAKNGNASDQALAEVFGPKKSKPRGR